MYNKYKSGSKLKQNSQKSIKLIKKSQNKKISKMKFNLITLLVICFGFLLICSSFTEAQRGRGGYGGGRGRIGGIKIFLPLACNFLLNIKPFFSIINN